MANINRMNANEPIHVGEDSFDAAVLKSPVPVLVDFWAPWCGPCKMIAPILDEIAREQAGKVLVAKIDVDQNPALAARFNIRGIPTMILFQNGAVKETIVGLTGKQALTGKIEALAA
jgi:thioredoxin